MSSRFSRHGTTGYRWPKVCISGPPVSPPATATSLWTLDINYNGTAFGFPTPYTGTHTSTDPVTDPSETWTLATYPQQPSTATGNAPIGGPTALISATFKGTMGFDLGITGNIPLRTVATPYDSGTVILGTSIQPNLGTGRLRIS